MLGSSVCFSRGRSRRYYIWVGKGAFDGAACPRQAGSRRMGEVLGFLGEYWKDLGIPEQVQFDNARELCGWGPVPQRKQCRTPRPPPAAPLPEQLPRPVRPGAPIL